jgi:hypothetical protein
LSRFKKLDLDEDDESLAFLLYFGGVATRGIFFSNTFDDVEVLRGVVGYPGSCLIRA